MLMLGAAGLARHIGISFMAAAPMPLCIYCVLWMPTSSLTNVCPAAAALCVSKLLVLLLQAVLC
jgi:hypothetical protein